MTKALSICALLLLAGCSMSNDEIIAETKKCEAAGMEAQQLAHMWSYSVVKIQCVPRYGK